MAQGNGLSSTSTRYILDTSIALFLIRGGAVGIQIDASFGLSRKATPALVSVVTIGELMALSYRAGWGVEKQSRYDKLLQELVRIDINDAVILDAYARIDCAAVAQGKKLSKNDLWIAACARATGSALLTTDKDFDFLEGVWIRRIWIDPSTGKAP
ncbi:PIN domain-containing protein [Aquisphaera insulae]|uniref:PIN domain-containing protein n=1 Tax=Aquisphaera insulae TaxID=2712864 RepID=UPI0013ED31BA|nr:PIN domain-containing protein [Aquisphaera insulae]